MAPDLNTVPRSPRNESISNTLSTTSISQSSGLQGPAAPSSRRTSTQMAPPPLPVPNSLPSSPRTSSTAILDNTGVGVGPGPLRHPRPLTAAELHLELEKEQESIVNRLTRELSALRAQTASVASTTSSTSDHLFSSADPYLTSTGAGATIIPSSARRHRSSSNLSARSARSIRDNLGSTATTSVSGVAAPRDQSVHSSSRPSLEISRPDISRQNSTSASAGSGFRSNSIAASPHTTQNAYPYPHRVSISSTSNATGGGLASVDGLTNQPTSTQYPRSPSFSTAIAAARYEEAALHRAELDTVKRENELLRARVKDLERNLAVAGHSRDTS